MKDGEKCRVGPHVPNPREDEKLRPQFKKMEELHGPWERGKFKYPTTAVAAAKKKEGEGAGKGVDDATPPASPRK